MKELIDAGASIYHFRFGYNVILYAVSMGNCKALSILLKNKLNGRTFYNYPVDIIQEDIYCNIEDHSKYSYCDNISDLMILMNILVNDIVDMETNVRLSDCVTKDNIVIPELVELLVKNNLFCSSLNEKVYKTNNFYSNLIDNYEEIFYILKKYDYDFVLFENKLRSDRGLYEQVFATNTEIIEFVINMYIENKIFDKIRSAHEFAVSINNNEMERIILSHVSKIDDKEDILIFKKMLS